MDPYESTAVEVSKRRVLVVDDETDVAYSFANLLEALGYCARCAYEGFTALATAAEFRPDTVVVDIGLPDMDGYELGRRLRELFPNVRVVALSGESTEEGQNMAKAFFDAFIPKPGSLRYIEQALAR